MSPGENVVHSVITPSLSDLKVEEDQAALEEESRIERKRLAAQELALKRGLDPRDADMV